MKGVDLVMVVENVVYLDIFSLESGFLMHLTRNMSASSYQNMSGKRFRCTSLDL